MAHGQLPSEDWRGGRDLDGLTTSSNSSKKSFSHTAKGMLGSVSAGLEEEEGPPALEAAAADPRGAFTAAAAEAGGGGGDEESYKYLISNIVCTTKIDTNFYNNVGFFHILETKSS